MERPLDAEAIKCGSDDEEPGVHPAYNALTEPIIHPLHEDHAPATAMDRLTAMIHPIFRDEEKLNAILEHDPDVLANDEDTAQLFAIPDEERAKKMAVYRKRYEEKLKRGAREEAERKREHEQKIIRRDARVAVMSLEEAANWDFSIPDPEVPESVYEELRKGVNIIEDGAPSPNPRPLAVEPTDERAPWWSFPTAWAHGMKMALHTMDEEYEEARERAAFDAADEAKRAEKIMPDSEHNQMLMEQYVIPIRKALVMKKRAKAFIEERVRSAKALIEQRGYSYSFDDVSDPAWAACPFDSFKHFGESVQDVGFKGDEGMIPAVAGALVVWVAQNPEYEGVDAEDILGEELVAHAHSGPHPAVVMGLLTDEECQELLEKYKRKEGAGDMSEQDNGTPEFGLPRSDTQMDLLSRIRESITHTVEEERSIILTETPGHLLHDYTTTNQADLGGAEDVAIPDRLFSFRIAPIDPCDVPLPSLSIDEDLNDESYHGLPHSATIPLSATSMNFDFSADDDVLGAAMAAESAGVVDQEEEKVYLTVDSQAYIFHCFRPPTPDEDVETWRERAPVSILNPKDKSVVNVELVPNEPILFPIDKADAADGDVNGKQQDMGPVEAAMLEVDTENRVYIPADTETVDWIKTADEYRFGLNGRPQFTSRKEQKLEVFLAQQPDIRLYMPAHRGFIERGYFSDILPQALKLPEITPHKVDPRDVAWVTHCMNQRIGLLAEDQLQKETRDSDGNSLAQHKWVKPTKAYPRTIAQGRPPPESCIQKRDAHAAVAMAVYQTLREQMLEEEPVPIFVRGVQRIIERAPGSERTKEDIRVPKAWLASPYLAALGVTEQGEEGESDEGDDEVDEYDISGDVTAISQEFEGDEQEVHQEWLASTHLAQKVHEKAGQGIPVDPAKMNEEEPRPFSNSAASVIIERFHDLIDDFNCDEQKREGVQRFGVLRNKRLRGLKPKRRVTYFRSATGASSFSGAPSTALMPIEKAAHGRFSFPKDPSTALVPLQSIHRPSSPPIPFPDLQDDFEETQGVTQTDASVHSKYDSINPRVMANTIFSDKKSANAESVASETSCVAFARKLREKTEKTEKREKKEKATANIEKRLAVAPEVGEANAGATPNLLDIQDRHILQRAGDEDFDPGSASPSPFAFIMKATNPQIIEAAVETVLAVTQLTPAKARAMIACFIDNVDDTSPERFFGKNFLAYAKEDLEAEEVVVSDEEAQRFFAKIIAKAERFGEDERTMAEEEDKVDIVPDETSMTSAKARALIDYVVCMEPHVDLITLLGSTFLIFANKDMGATPVIVNDEEADCFFERALEKMEAGVEADTTMIENANEEEALNEASREASPHEGVPEAKVGTTMIKKADVEDVYEETPVKADAVEVVPLEWPMTPAQAFSLFIWFVEGVDKGTFDIVGFFSAKFLAYAEEGQHDAVKIADDDEGERLLELFVHTLNRMERAEAEHPEQPMAQGVVLYEGDRFDWARGLSGPEPDPEPESELKPPSVSDVEPQSESESDETETPPSMDDSHLKVVSKLLKSSQVQAFAAYLEKQKQPFSQTREITAYMELPDDAPRKRFELTRRENGLYNQMLIERKVTYEKRKQAYEKGEFGYALGLTERTDPDLLESVIEKEGSLISSDSSSSSDSSLEEQEGETLIDSEMKEAGDAQLSSKERRKSDYFGDWEDINYEVDGLGIVIPKRGKRANVRKASPERTGEGTGQSESPSMGSSVGAFGLGLSLPDESTPSVSPHFGKPHRRHLSASGPARDPETAAKIAFERQKLYDNTFNPPLAPIHESPSCQALQIGASIGLQTPVREGRATDEVKSPATFGAKSRRKSLLGPYETSPSRNSVMVDDDSDSGSEASTVGVSNVSRVLLPAKTNESEQIGPDDGHHRSRTFSRPSMDQRKPIWRSSFESPSISSGWVTVGPDSPYLLEEDGGSPVSATDGVVRSPKPISPEKVLTGRKELTDEALEELALLARNERIARVLAAIDAAVKRSYEIAFEKQAKAKRKEEREQARLEAGCKAEAKKREEEARRRTRAEDMLGANREAENGNPDKLTDLLRRHVEEDSEVRKELPPDPAEELERLAAQAHHDHLHALDPIAKFNDALMIAIKVENLQVDEIEYLFNLIAKRDAAAEDDQEDRAFQFYHIQEHQERMQLLAEQAEYLGAMATIKLWRQSHAQYVDPDYFMVEEVPVLEDDEIENEDDDLTSEGSSDTGIVYERVEALELADLITAFNECQGTELPASGDIIKAAKDLRKQRGSNNISPEKERNEAAATPPERRKSLNIAKRVISTRRSVEAAPRPLAEPATIAAGDGSDLIKVLSYTSVKEGPKPSLVDSPRIKSKQEVLQMELMMQKAAERLPPAVRTRIGSTAATATAAKEPEKASSYTSVKEGPKPSMINSPRVKSKQEVLQMELMLQKARERLSLDVVPRSGSIAAAVAAIREQEEATMFKDSREDARSSASFSGDRGEGSLAVDYPRKSVDAPLERRKSKKLVKRRTLVPSSEAAPDALPKPSLEGRTVSGDRRFRAPVIADPVPARQSSVRSSIKSFSLRPMSANPDRISAEASVVAEPVPGRQFSAGSFSLRQMSVVREAGDMPTLTRTATTKSQVSLAPSDESKKSKSKKWRMSLGPKSKDKSSGSPPPPLLSPSADAAPSTAPSELKRISSIFKRKEQKRRIEELRSDKVSSQRH